MKRSRLVALESDAAPTWGKLIDGLADLQGCELFDGKRLMQLSHAQAAAVNDRLLGLRKSLLCAMQACVQINRQLGCGDESSGLSERRTHAKGYLLS